MKQVTANDADAPADIAELIHSARVAIFRSNLTDTRRLIAHLERTGIDYQEITMGMGSGVERDRFHRLRDWTQWPLLPQVFVDGVFVGGADDAIESPPLAD